MTIYEILDELKISYEEISHKAVFTVDEANAIEEQINGLGCKNLFLTNKKGKTIWLKWFFYIYYPLHLIIIGILRMIIYGNIPLLFN